MRKLTKLLFYAVAMLFSSYAIAQTADEQIFPHGTAFICDVGMTGPHPSILGRRIDRVLPTAVSFMPSPFDVAEGDVCLGGAIVDLDTETGKATAIRRVSVDEKWLAGRQPGDDPP